MSYRFVLGSIAGVAIALTVLLLVHPTLGYANESSVISGADLRAKLIGFLWLGAAGACAVASGVLYLVGRIRTANSAA